MGLRQMAGRSSARSEFPLDRSGLEFKVSRRLKRADRIVEKLRRFPFMSLARMADIGGARIVVPRLNDLADIHRRIMHTWGHTIVGTNE